MRYRRLGPTGLRVSELFLGATSFTARWGPGDPDEYQRMLGTYADAGGNVIDTALAYEESEEVVGALLTGQRDRFVLATKYTATRDPADPNASGNHRKNLRLSLETSLRRLRTDHIDLYWVQVWDRHTPIEETMRALDDAVHAGKILYTGFSNAPAWLVARANTLSDWRGWTPFAGIQVPYNLLDRDIERELLPMAHALGLSVAAWRPMAQGALAGLATRPLSPREQTIVSTVQDVAVELNATAAQVAVAWILARSGAIHPIIAATSANQLAESLGSTAVRLPEEAITRLTAATDFTAGYPADFITAGEHDPWLYGDTARLVDPPRALW
ncbi:aldo/keto reductase [Micromonospora ureilytica]|uniref:aldo/keto reductase n=1 Tax=Micromonospora ureilytica TaxID=709868 RepID=UPI002E147706|nr:aldo/keto reductase [Micromonospora ureilytica]